MRAIRPLVLFATLALATGLAAADAAQKVSVELRTAQKFHFGKRSSRIELRVKHPTLNLIELSPKSTVERFEDDLGNDLRQPRRRRGEVEGRDMFDNLKEWSVDVFGKRVSAEAKTIRAKGTLRFLGASKTKAVRGDLGSLEPGSKLKVGDYTFNVMSHMQQEMDGPDSPARTVVMTLNVDDSRIAAIRFLDEAGKPIDMESLGTGKSRVFGHLTISYNFHLQHLPTKAHIELDLWDDLQDVEIPFDFTQKIVR